MNIPTTQASNFTVWVKPNAQQTEYLGYRKDRKAHVFRIQAPPTKNNANKELLDYLAAVYNITCKIVRGKNARKKVLEVLN